MNIQHCTILLPPVWSGVYYNTARLLKYAFEDLGISATIGEAGDDEGTELSVVLGWNLVPDELQLRVPYIIYQLEPLCLQHWQEKINSRISFFRNALGIWDYAADNQKYLEDYGLESMLVPVGYHQKMEEASPVGYTDYDVLFVGFLTERRKRILEELNNHCCVSIQPRWGNDFSDALTRSKILLNIHQYDIPTPLEQPRIAYALNNHAFVLSETSLDNPWEKIVSCSYDTLIRETIDYLHHSNARRERNDQMFHAFRSVSMKDNIEKMMR